MPIEPPCCQSCAMPLVNDESYGTHEDGSKSEDYCCYCYQKGAFTAPELTMDEMIAKVVEIMKQMGISNEIIEATQLRIPTLKRWEA